MPGSRSSTDPEHKSPRESGEDSEDESEILEESPCGRWLKRREEVRILNLFITCLNCRDTKLPIMYCILKISAFISVYVYIVINRFFFKTINIFPYSFVLKNNL